MYLSALKSHAWQMQYSVHHQTDELMRSAAGLIIAAAAAAAVVCVWVRDGGLVKRRRPDRISIRVRHLQHRPFDADVRGGVAAVDRRHDKVARREWPAPDLGVAGLGPFILDREDVAEA